MELGLIGLGKMGGNMTKRLVMGGHTIKVFDRNAEAINNAVSQGAIGTSSVADLIAQLATPRAIWIMVPSGAPTEQTILDLAALMSPGDTILDGGNSNYKDSIRRANMLAERQLHFIDVGTSGGIWGLTEGYALMIGGPTAPVKHLYPIFETLAPAVDRGWGHVGPSGAGHFTKMIHNGIEYGLMQAYAEGFELLYRKEELNLDLHQIAEIWRHGSVVRSWLLDLTARALAQNPDLDGIAGFVPDSGEGRWTVAEAIELGVSIPVISLSLQRRFRSREQEPFSDKLLASLRDQFGGHGVQKK